jgi:nitrous oxidase accessory protein NosD
MRRRTFIAGFGSLAAAGAAAMGTGAFTSVEVDRSVSVEVADDDAALLGLEPSPGPNGEYATQSGGRLGLDFSDTNAGGSGVGTDSVYQFDDVFRVTNRGTQPVYVWATLDFSSVGFGPGDVYLYPDGDEDEKLRDGTDEVLGLGVGQSASVGVYVDSAAVSSGGTLSATIHANADKPDPSQPVDGGGEDFLVVTENPTESNEYASIQAAIDAANGTTVLVEPGRYEEDVTLDEPGLTLRAAGGGETTIEGRVVASSDGVTLDGFTVSPPPAARNTESEAVRVSGTASEVTVENNVVDGFARDDPGGGFYGVDGINVFGGRADAPVADVAVRNNEVRGLRNEDQGGVAGVSVQGNVEDVTVSDNTLSGLGEAVTAYGFGVTVRGTGNHEEKPRSVTVRNNSVDEVQSDDGDLLGVGLAVEADATDCAFEGNEVADTELGVEVKAGADGASFVDNAVDETDIRLADTTGDVALGAFLDENDVGDAAATDTVESESFGSYEQAVFSTISRALDVSASGARVDVAPGTYGADSYGDTPGLQIGSQDAGTDPESAPLADVRVVGRGTPTVDGWVQILDPGVTFEGFEVTGEVFGFGVAAFEPDVTLRDVTVSGVTNGLFVPSAEGVLVENCTVEDYSFYGALVSGRGTFGGATPTVRDTTFDGSSGGGAVGVGVVQTAADVEANTATGNETADGEGAGVAHFSGADAVIQENEVASNDDGIFLAGPDAGTVTATSNDIVDNQVGVVNDGEGDAVDATGNWWGSDAGPGAGSNTEGTEGPVDADLWSTAAGPDWNTEGTPSGLSTASVGAAGSGGVKPPSPPANPESVDE